MHNTHTLANAHQVTRPGEGTVKCTILLTINHQVGSYVASESILTPHLSDLTATVNVASC